MRNKKTFIIVIFILLVALGAVGFLLLDNKKNFDQTVKTEEDAKGKEKTVVEKKQEFVELQKNTKKKIVKKLYKIKEENCARVTNEGLKKDCYDFINFDKAIEKGDIAVCQAMATKLKDSCFYQLSLKAGTDPLICEKIDDSSSLKDLCYRQVAVRTKDITYCDQMRDDKTSCQEEVTANQSYKEGIKVCKTIKSPQYFSFCVKNSRNDCSQLEGKEMIKKCESWRLFDQIIYQGKKEYCDILPLEEFKEVCQAYFDNDKKYSDIDDDGISDWEELYFGFNPLVANDQTAVDKVKSAKEKMNIANDVYADFQAKLYRLMLDTDEDGLRDYEEDIFGTDINNPDTDGDGFSDGTEVKGGHNPLN